MSGTKEAAGRLEAAMAEQARLSDRYARSIGTANEHSAYFRLRAASARVSKQDRVIREMGRVGLRAPRI